MSEKEMVTNIFGDEIEACCYDPMTGYFRDGFCNTDEHDYGSHVVCAVMTDDFLKFSKSKYKFCDKNFRMIKMHVCSVFKRV